MALKGGDSGPVILPGKAIDSLLLQRIRSRESSEQMPPKGERLTEQQIQLLARLDRSGSAWAEIVERRSLQNPLVLQGGGAARSPESGCQRLGAKCRGPFHRRPPGERGVEAVAGGRSRHVDPPAEVRPARPAADAGGDRAFVRTGADAYEQLVERYLGLAALRRAPGAALARRGALRREHRLRDEPARPNAWPYRDYVIRAFNEDVPYDRFVREQLAGERRREARRPASSSPGPRSSEERPGPDAQQRADELHDIVSTTGSPSSA